MLLKNAFPGDFLTHSMLEQTQMPMSKQSQQSLSCYQAMEVTKNRTKQDPVCERSEATTSVLPEYSLSILQNLGSLKHFFMKKRLMRR
jgi:hypothetical protein